MLDIIDGQQRMTTLSILVLSAMRLLDEQVRRGLDADNNRERMDVLRRTYIGQKDAVTLMVSPKLTLNRNNNDYYRDHLASLGSMPARNIKATEHLMRKATDWFEKIC